MINKNYKTTKGRPKSIRKISFMPSVSGFKPYGGNAKSSKNDGVFLLYEEYESVRLNDYEKHTQCESAAIMGVSRPTFTRIYMSAREKIAKAFIEGRRIIIEGGKVELNNEWYVCADCHAIFTASALPPTTCALCNSTAISRYNPNEMERAQNITDISTGLELDRTEEKCCRRRGNGHCREHKCDSE